MDVTAIENNDDHAVLRQFFSRGGSVRMLADIDQNDLALLYTYASQLFESQQFEGARNIYYMLTQIDHWNFNSCLALGRCYQQLGQHEDAIFCFSRSGMIKLDDPRSSFFAGISYRIVGNVEYAGKAFNAALKWCGSCDEHSEIKREAAQLLALCALEKQS